MELLKKNEYIIVVFIAKGNFYEIRTFLGGIKN